MSLMFFWGAHAPSRVMLGALAEHSLPTLFRSVLSAQSAVQPLRLSNWLTNCHPGQHFFVFTRISRTIPTKEGILRPQ